MVVRSSIYSDFDIELTKQTDGDIKKVTDVDAIVNSLNNIISTMQGSRRMIPEFAHDVWELLFEPLDEEAARMIGEGLLIAIRNWEDRVEVKKVDVTPDFDANLYKLSMEFLIKPIEEVTTIDFVLYTQ